MEEGIIVTCKCKRGCWGMVGGAGWEVWGKRGVGCPDEGGG